MPIPAAAYLAGMALPYVPKIADEFVLAPVKELGKKFGKWTMGGGDDDKKQEPGSTPIPKGPKGGAFTPPTDPVLSRQGPAFVTGNQAPSPIATGAPTSLLPHAGSSGQPSGSDFMDAMQEKMGGLYDQLTNEAFNPRTGQRSTPSPPSGLPVPSNRGVPTPSAFGGPLPDSLMPDQIAAGAAPGPGRPSMPLPGGLAAQTPTAGAVERQPGLSLGPPGAFGPGPMGGGGGAFAGGQDVPGIKPPVPAATVPATNAPAGTAFAPPSGIPGQRPTAPGQPTDPSIAIAGAISQSPGLHEAVQNPTTVFPDPDKYIQMMIKEGEFSDEEGNKISSMSKDEKSEMLLEMGLRMMVAGGQGQNPLAAFGAAGLGSLDTFRANRAQVRETREKRATRRATIYGKAAEISQAQADAIARAQEAAARVQADREKMISDQLIAQGHDATSAANAAAQIASQERQQEMQKQATLGAASISAGAPSQEQRTLEYMTRPKEKGGLGLTPQEAMAQSGAASHDVRRDIAWYKAQQQTLRKDDLSFADTPEKRDQINKEIDAEVDKVFGPGSSGSVAPQQQQQGDRAGTIRRNPKTGEQVILNENGQWVPYQAEQM